MRVVSYFVATILVIAMVAFSVESSVFEGAMYTSNHGIGVWDRVFRIHPLMATRYWLVYLGCSIVLNAMFEYYIGCNLLPSVLSLQTTSDYSEFYYHPFLSLWISQR